MADRLARVKRATKARERSEEAWQEAIRTAFAEGASSRDIGAAAGITHKRVLQIVREK